MTAPLTLPPDLPFHTQEDDMGLTFYITRYLGRVLMADSLRLLAALVLETEAAA